MTILNEFEKEIGISAEMLDEKAMIQIMANPEYSHFFTNTKEAIDLLDSLIEKNQDSTFKKELNTIKISIQLLENEDIINKIFKKYRDNKITRAELLKDLERFRNSSDPIFVISVFICSLIATQDVDLKIEEDKLKKAILETKNLVDDLGRLENSYLLQCNIVDLIYQVRERYFDVYEIDILKDIPWVDEKADELNEYEYELNNGFVVPNVDVTPEQLGFINITKLKHEE